MALLHGGRAWLVHELFGQIANGERHGGREQPRLAGGGQGGQNRLHIFDKAHAQHLVRLIQNNGLYTADIEHVFAEQIEQTAGGGYDHINSAPQTADLWAIRLATVNGQNAHANVLPQLFKGFGDLHGQFAGGSNHQRLGRILFGDEGVEDGQTEGGRFASACLRLAEYIMPFEEQRNDGRLDGGGGGVAQFGDSLQ